jgi:IS30 family transposase
MTAGGAWPANGPIADRPPSAENRSCGGHHERDTVISTFKEHCILTLSGRPDTA